MNIIVSPEEIREYERWEPLAVVDAVIKATEAADDVLGEADVLVQPVNRCPQASGVALSQKAFDVVRIAVWTWEPDEDADDEDDDDYEIERVLSPNDYELTAERFTVRLKPGLHFDGRAEITYLPWEQTARRAEGIRAATGRRSRTRIESEYCGGHRWEHGRR